MTALGSYAFSYYSGTPAIHYGTQQCSRDLQPLSVRRRDARRHRDVGEALEEAIGVKMFAYVRLCLR